MKTLFSTLFLLFTGQLIWAQMNDFQRIALNVYVPEATTLFMLEEEDDGEDFPNVAIVLKNKLEAIVTANGLTGGERSPRFSLMPKISVLEKSLSSGAPTYHVLDLELHLFIVDWLSFKKYASTTLPLKGVDVSEQKAFMGAIRSLSNNSLIRQFLDEGKQKILQHYNDQCDYILMEAETLASMKKYDEALIILTQVPQACQACYKRAISMIPSYFKSFYDRKCDEDLAEAKRLWAGGNSETVVKVDTVETGKPISGIDPNSMAKAVQENKKANTMKGASVSANHVPEALKYLVEILPDCACYQEAQKIIAEIKNSTHRHEHESQQLFEMNMELQRDESKRKDLAIQKNAELEVELAKTDREYWRAKQRDANVNINKF